MGASVLRACSSSSCKVFRGNRNWSLVKPQASFQYLHAESRHDCAGRGLIGDNTQIKELEIPFPFGTVRAKAWGSESAHPVLALHGWMDNCGTFDRLIPLLSDQFYFVAPDAPGHGLSSHKPPDAMYTCMGMVKDIKRVTEYLGWEKFHVMGHSMGSSHAMLFSAFYPGSVGKIVSLDLAMPLCAPAHEVVDIRTKAMQDLIEIEKKMYEPSTVYTRESAKLKLMKGAFNEITDDVAEILLKRAIKLSDCGTKLFFRRDSRCSQTELISAESEDVMYNFMSALRCEMLIILAVHRHPAYLKLPGTSIEISHKFMDLYRKTLKKFVLEQVKGNHFVHLNNSEKIAPIVNKFLLD